jgi:hypothetical protein
VTYKGACHVPVSALRPETRKQDIRIDPQGIAVGETGPHAFSLYDLDGRRLWHDQGIGSKTWLLRDIRGQAGIRAGVYLARVRTPAGEVNRRISLF